jgi:DNA-binding CsgD family transcriptional regulator
MPIAAGGVLRPDVVAKLLRSADDFVGISTVVVENACRCFELALCAVTLLSTSGVPAIVVANECELSDAERQRYATRGLLDDPLYQFVVDTRAPIASDDILAHGTYMTLARKLGYTGEDLHFMMLPILEPDGLLGTIHCGRRREFTPAMRRDLSVLAGHVSVRLAQLGITTTSELGTLSHRQHEVARLAARGLANHQIATSLGVSENTIKKHLKDVFTRLGIANRTELAMRLAHAGKRNDLPLGITRAGAVVVTRAT